MSRFARMSMASTTSQTWFGIGIMAVAAANRPASPRTRLATRSSSRPDCAGARRLPKREGSSGRHQRQRRLCIKTFAPCVASASATRHSIRSPSNIPVASDRSGPMLQDAAASTPHRAVSPSPAPPEKHEHRTASAAAYRWWGWALTVHLGGSRQARRRIHGSAARARR